MDSLGDRMKNFYEDRSRIYLTRRTPVIIRVDGKAFHTLTKTAEKPFDGRLISAMVWAAIKTSDAMQGFCLGYVQSDEVSFLLLDTKTLTTEAWFDNNLQKLVSISAATMTAQFGKMVSEFEPTGWVERARNHPPVFDARAFNIPLDEVANYFLWRQKDWCRNSVQMLARAHFSHSELHGKGQRDAITMLEQKGVFWDQLEPHLKNGTFFTSNRVVRPEFEQIRDLVQECVTPKEVVCLS